MKYISAKDNPSIKAVKSLETKKARDKSGLFVVEGFRVIQELAESMPELINEIFVSQAFADAHEKELSNFEHTQRIRVTCVADSIFKKLCNTETPQGILATVRKFKHELTELLETGRTVVVLENISDPGNLGTIIRTVDAVGAAGIVLAGNCTDLYNPKVVRSTMGSLMRVPVCHISGDDYIDELSIAMKSANYEMYAAHLQGAVDCFETEFSSKCVLLMGNEANGLTDELTAKADKCIKIPIEGKAESLNLGIATGVLLYEAYRKNKYNCK